MKRLRRLDVRLFVSYALVVGVVVAALAITFGLRATSDFDDRIRGHENAHLEKQTHQAFVDALWSTLPIALVLSVGGAGIVTLFVTRRILRPINDVRSATKRLAAGHYDERVTPPGELELAALASDVNQLAAALETTERRRAQLISEVSHEMRTPLTTISGYVEGIIDGVFSPTDEVLATVSEETARLERLVSDLATLSRAEENALPLKITREDLGALAAAVAARLRPQFDDQNVTLEVQGSAALPVDVDRDRVIQVIANLLGNALTYTPAGGRVVLEWGERAGAATMTVRDTGVGIADDDLGLIFERFYRVPDLPRPSGGSGIGLTIARSIARAHHGDITAASPGRDQGSTFTLELPLAGD
jgi:signal transduction histidine kinase